MEINSAIINYRIINSDEKKNFKGNFYILPKKSFFDYQKKKLHIEIATPNQNYKLIKVLNITSYIKDLFDKVKTNDDSFMGLKIILCQISDGTAISRQSEPIKDLMVCDIPFKKVIDSSSKTFEINKNEGGFIIIHNDKNEISELSKSKIFINGFDFKSFRPKENGGGVIIGKP